MVGGIITGVVAAAGCEHHTGTDIDHNAVTVQLMPYLDTPNPGGEYKAWAVTVEDFLAGCVALGVNNGLDVVDCGRSPGNAHGFISRHSKTDNFKVGQASNLELTWIDTLGVANVKWSYYKPALGITHFAHIEAVEVGVHQIVVADQPGCKVGKFFWRAAELSGPGIIDVPVKQNDREWTKYLSVYCAAP